MFNDSLAEVFNILAKSWSCGNIYFSYKHYQPGKITLQVSMVMIFSADEYLVASSYEKWMM